MISFKQAVLASAFTLSSAVIPQAYAVEESYSIDPAHSFVQFTIGHLGVSKTVGRFNKFEGNFQFDKDNSASNGIELTIETASIDTNHQKRDDHLRSPDFLDVKQYPEMTFKSTGFEGSLSSGTLKGELTMHGVTQPVEFKLNQVGEGKDPWGGYRAGFTASTTVKRSDFGVTYFIPGVSDQTEIAVFIEGIRKK
ncbi:YceI family protein [Motiliproteus sp. MSK22-1]|uniref:YceI family protein n=1 Tax=Motiliproteus sp. MSK22-1 TaxID=1897630 RepID=UPI000977DC2C|nr:YceI family protein [Motiliproteus sp. MSK22-1]OMH38182.1 hypothetical protein BGP75_07950 [Motiliproteus sp. MSK22-1]